MTEYLSGAQAIADARLRVRGLPPQQGVLLLEGRDDVRLFGPHSFGLETVIPCGSKPKLLDAYSRIRPGEERLFLFIADCDYDVPAGKLAPSRNLVLTTNVDVETDLLDLGLLDRLVLETVPSAVVSETHLASLSSEVLSRSVALAEAIGQLRQVSAVEGLGLSFDGLRYHRYRSRGEVTADRAKLAKVTREHAGEPVNIDPGGLETRAAAIPGGLRVCHGKDLIGAIAAVLHEDYGVPAEQLRFLPSLLRTAVDSGVLTRWALVRRIRRWETQTGRRVLR